MKRIMWWAVQGSNL